MPVPDKDRELFLHDGKLLQDQTGHLKYFWKKDLRKEDEN